MSADSEAPTAKSPFSAPSANVPESCGDDVDYTEINELSEFVTGQLSYEMYLKNRLSHECGETAEELGTIASDLDTKLENANTLREECLDQFYGAFHQEGQTFEAFTMYWENAFEEAKTAGEIPENDYSVNIPDSPDTCSHFVDSVEMEISTKLEDLKGKHDFTNFLIHDVCQNLGELVSNTLEENKDADSVIASRIADILNDILAIEGNEDEDHLQLEMRLRKEFMNAYDAEKVESEIKLPSDSVPEKCADSVSYEDLDTVIKLNSENLSFEKWLEGRLLKACGSAEADFDTVLDDLQEKIEQAEFDKTEITTVFYKEWINPSAASGYGQSSGRSSRHTHAQIKHDEDSHTETEEEVMDTQEMSETGEEQEEMMEIEEMSETGEEEEKKIPTFAEYAVQLREAFNAAQEAGEITDPFTYDVDLPETPESCESVVTPFIAEVEEKITELGEYKDCI